MWRLLFVSVLWVLAAGDRKRYSIYETIQNILDDGFPAETHNVTTSDGYILEMHRIPHGRVIENTADDKPVVFLMHGLMSASNSFIGLGPDNSFAYHLADAGFDVWMGNNRGNKNSRAHISLDPDDEEEKFQFWDFSFEEIGMYDLPAMIDYVLEYTGKEKLHYIGHSQGGTVFLVLTTMVPEYNDKLTSVHLLAGVGYMQYFPNEDLRQLAVTTDIIYNVAINLGVVELYPPNSTAMIPDGILPDGLLPDLFPYSADQTVDACTGNPDSSYLCELFGVRYLLMTDTTNSTDEETSEETDAIDDEDDVLLQPAGAALKQIAHYGQNIRDRRFRRYHRGTFGNLAAYGSLTPPAYNLGRITANVTMHYSLSDILLDERDVLDMVADMPNAVARKVARESFLHEDFVVALDAKELVTDYIIEAIKSGERQENEEEFIPVTDPTPPVTGIEVITVDPDLGTGQDTVTDDPNQAEDSNSPDQSEVTNSPITVIEETGPTASPVVVIESPSTDSGYMIGVTLQLYLGVLAVYLTLK